MTIAALAPARSPCSVGEREAASALAERLAKLGLRPSIESVRAATSPTWAPMLRALFRVWAAAFLAAGLTIPAVLLGAVAVLGGVPAAAALLRYVPLLGGQSQNVSVRIPGTNPETRPVVVSAHVDTHPTDGEPLYRAHRYIAAASGVLVFASSLAGGTHGWRAFTGLIAAEAILTLGWLARRELSRYAATPDDNTSGLMALERVAELALHAGVRSDLWVVATGAATSGGWGMTTFLRDHADVRSGWVIDIDALGSGEVVAAPMPSRFPHPGTPSSLMRAIVAAARATGDPMAVRRVRRPHSDARTALRSRVAAITLTAGILHPARERGPDAANAARAARVAHELAVLPDEG
jgi:hypothetical protein